MNSGLLHILDYQFPGLVWKLQLDESNKLVAIEVRDEKKLALSYYLINLKNAEVTEIGDVEGMGWWSSLSGIAYPYLYFSAYSNQEQPDPTLKLFHLDSREVTHEFPHFNLTGFSGNYLYGYESGYDVKQRTINISKGVLEDWDGQLPAEQKGMLYPDFFDVSDESAISIGKFLDSIGVRPCLGYEYCEVGDSITLSYYIENGKKYDRFILVLRKGELIHHEVLDQGMDGLALESHVILGNLILYVKNRMKIYVYEI